MAVERWATTPQGRRGFIIEGDVPCSVGCVDGDRQCLQQRVLHLAPTFDVERKSVRLYHRFNAAVEPTQLVTIL